MSVWVRENRWFWFNGHPYLTIGMNLTMSGLSLSLYLALGSTGQLSIACWV